jgi:hypothetical protein
MSKHHGAPDLFAALWSGKGLILMTGLPAAPAAAFGRA